MTKLTKAQISASIQPEYLVCFEDGKKLKTLKRHLKANYGLSPNAYRKKWGVSSNYPMIAPDYAKERARIAKLIGKGGSV